MQIKKDEVRQAILKEAEKEFYKQGFLNASIRRIVKTAGTTIGNFYNYFESKEAIFEELVKDEYNSFQYFIQNHDKLVLPDYLSDMSDAVKWRKMLAEVIQGMLPAFSDRFILLVECSKGTKYENTRQRIVDLMKEHFVEHIRHSDLDSMDEKLGEIIAEQLMVGFIMILRKYRDEKVRKYLLTEHLLYHFAGTMGFLGDWDKFQLR